MFPSPSALGFAANRRGALRIFCDGERDSFSALGLWVEATDLKTHGSDPFKVAAYSE